MTTTAIETAAVAAGKPWVAIFDLDGTLTWRDTLLPFLLGFIRQHPGAIRGLWRLPAALLFFAVRNRDRGELKSRLIRMVMAGETREVIDAWTDSFVMSLRRRERFRPKALAVLETHRGSGDHLVLLSASPDLYVPNIGSLLNVERTVCTELQWRGDRLDGALKTQNCRGQEKRRCLQWLRSQYPGLPVIAYGNSASDLDHMRIADRALLVNGGRAARELAAKCGISSTDWA